MAVTVEDAIEQLGQVSQSLFLPRPSVGLPKGSIVVRQLENALCLAGRRPWPDPQPYEWVGDTGVSWHDLREDCKSHPIPLQVRKAAGRVFETPFAQRKLFDIADEANADARIVVAHLVGGGKAGDLGDLLLRAYIAGGWPCGWKGKFPEGCLLVYWPHKETPELDDE